MAAREITGRIYGSRAFRRLQYDVIPYCSWSHNPDAGGNQFGVFRSSSFAADRKQASAGVAAFLPSTYVRFPPTLSSATLAKDWMNRQSRQAEYFRPNRPARLLVGQMVRERDRTGAWVHSDAAFDRDRGAR